MPADLSKTQSREAYDVFYNGTSLGNVDGVTVDIDPVFDPVQVGSLGRRRVGKRIVELEGTITVELRDVDEPTIRSLIPWAPTGPDPIPMLPAGLNKDLYDYAQKLVLHPQSAGTATTKDLTLLKAVPQIDWPDLNGEGDTVITVEFDLFPDRDALPETTTYGYVGPEPT
jgi:hypothetical protein